MPSLKIYVVNKHDHNLISLPNPDHLARRICSGLWYEKEEKDHIQYRFNSIVDAIENVNYIRKYLKQRGMFLKTLEILEKPDLFIESECKFFEENREGIYQQDGNIARVFFKSDQSVIPSD